MKRMTRRREAASIDEGEIMSKQRFLTLTLATLALAASGGAMAGSWPNMPAKKTVEAGTACCGAMAGKTTMAGAAGSAASAGGFEFVGGETGWQLRSPKYEFSGGGIAHAADCPLTVAAARVAPASGAPIDPSPGA